MIIKFFKNFFIKVLTLINSRINLLLKKLVLDNTITNNTTNILKVVKTSIDKDLRCLTLIIHNQDLDFGIDNLQDIITSQRLLFNVITNADEYNNYGDNKAIMLIGLLENGNEYSLHHNVYLNNNSTANDYYNQVIDLVSIYDNDNGYRRDFIPYFKVRIWNLDNYLNKNIKVKQNSIAIAKATTAINYISKRTYSCSATNNSNSRNYITPLMDGEIKLNEFAALDIETVVAADAANTNKQIPYLITLTHYYNTIYFQASNPSTSCSATNDNSLFNELINYLIDNKISHIFAH
jgi:hypothetical protein